MHQNSNNTLGYPQIDAPTRMPEVSGAVNRLNGSVSNNQDLVGRLMVRLEPVLATRGSVNGSKAEGPKPVASVPLAGTIDDVTLNVDRSNMILADLLERLEL